MKEPCSGFQLIQFVKYQSLPLALAALWNIACTSLQEVTLINHASINPIIYVMIFPAKKKPRIFIEKMQPSKRRIHPSECFAWQSKIFTHKVKARLKNAKQNIEIVSVEKIKIVFFCVFTAVRLLNLMGSTRGIYFIDPSVDDLLEFLFFFFYAYTTPFSNLICYKVCAKPKNVHFINFSNIIKHIMLQTSQCSKINFRLLDVSIQQLSLWMFVKGIWILVDSHGLFFYQLFPRI